MSGESVWLLHLEMVLYLIYCLDFPIHVPVVVCDFPSIYLRVTSVELQYNSVFFFLKIMVLKRHMLKHCTTFQDLEIQIVLLFY